MKAITLLLLVLVSATCLLAIQAESDPSNDVDLDYELDSKLDYELEIDQFLDEMDDEDDLMEVEDYGLIRSIIHILHRVLKTVRGSKCVFKGVADILYSCSNFVDAVESCGTEIPKDVEKIVDSVKQIIKICDDILHLRSKLCAKDKSFLHHLKNSFKCFWKLFRSTIKLTKKIHKTLKLIGKLPADTNVCFLNATSSVKVSFNSFFSNIKVCRK
ncbi:uncharacterized protein [Drosophila bipectinata]|uniref:uncharacterized protein n=1 Tax=Drosophila bipectinata TaxID=42026 RepID=UPI001C89E65E|nr:uncharacterized protein LOC108130428 [Drosophila bipectinata]